MMDEATFEKYNQFIRGGDLNDVFSDVEQYELISYGLLKKLTLQPDQESYLLIKTIILNSTDIDLINACFDELSFAGTHGDHLAIDCLFDLAIEHENKTATKIIQENNFLSGSKAINAVFYLFTRQEKQLYAINRPLYAIQSYYRQTSEIQQKKMLQMADKIALKDWTSSILCLQNLSDAQVDDGIHIFNSLPSPSKKFFLGQLIYHYLHNASGALALLLNLFFHNEDAITKHFLNTSALKSIPPKEQALFLLIDEQWDRFQQIDPGSKYLQQIYQEVDNTLRVKILQKTRTAGIDFILSSPGMQKKAIKIEDLSVADWQSILKSINTNEERQTLWRLAQIAPPYWSQHILTVLQAINFEPISDEEKIFFHALQKSRPELPSDCDKSLFILSKQHHFPGDYQYAALNSDMFALYSSADSSISFCQSIADAKPHISKIIPPRSLMPAITFSDDKKFLIWADVEQHINIYDLNRERIIKRFPAHENIIRNIKLSTDQRHLYSASFDGSIQAWRFPDGTHEKMIFSDQNEIYAMVLTNSGDYLISGDISGNLHIFSTDSMDMVHELSASSTPITGLSNPAGQIIVINSAKNQIAVWNFLSKKGLNQYTDQSNTGKITKLLLIIDEKQLFVATDQGILSLVDSLSGKLYEKFGFDPSPILLIENTKTDLWILQRNGNARMMNISVWQQILLAANQTGEQRLSNIDDLLCLPQLTSFQKEWLEFTKSLILWQKRFDISIEEIQTSISIDDFSITT
ncbi:MAG: hypothetical protein JEZ00_00370 [Anaerolineaceae bacterium]|nr:hypothetical protein [Anaerolineaceae bacterium]